MHHIILEASELISYIYSFNISRTPIKFFIKNDNNNLFLYLKNKFKQHYNVNNLLLDLLKKKKDSINNIINFNGTFIFILKSGDKEFNDRILEVITEKLKKKIYQIIILINQGIDYSDCENFFFNDEYANIKFYRYFTICNYDKVFFSMFINENILGSKYEEKYVTKKMKKEAENFLIQKYKSSYSEDFLKKFLYGNIFYVEYYLFKDMLIPSIDYQLFTFNIYSKIKKIFDEENVKLFLCKTPLNIILLYRQGDYPFLCNKQFLLCSGLGKVLKKRKADFDAFKKFNMIVDYSIDEDPHLNTLSISNKNIQFYFTVMNVDFYYSISSKKLGKGSIGKYLHDEYSMVQWGSILKYYTFNKKYYNAYFKEIGEVMWENIVNNRMGIVSDFSSGLTSRKILVMEKIKNPYTKKIEKYIIDNNLITLEKKLSKFFQIVL